MRQAIRHAAQLRGVSRERIGDELRRMLAHRSRAAAAQLLQSLTLDSPVLDEPTRNAPTPLLASLVPAIVPNAPELGLTLAAWATDRFRHHSGLPWLPPEEGARLVRQYRAALCLSNEEAGCLSKILATTFGVIQNWKLLPISKRKRMASNDLFPLSLRLIQAADPVIAREVEGDCHALSGDGIGVCPDPLISGDDLVAGGYTPSPRFKEILDAVYDAQLEGRVRDRAAALELARSLGV